MLCDLAGVSSALSYSSLQSVLDPQDKPLGPWEIVAEPLEEQLQLMTGDKGGPVMHPWEAGLGVQGVAELGDKRGGVRADKAPAAFPQQQSLGVSLVEIQLRLLGKFLSSVANKNKVHVLEVRGTVTYVV